MIALVTRLPEAAETFWLAALRAVMPQETILPIGDMSPETLSLVDIAIVANPDPADLLRLPNLEWVQSLWAGVERLVADLQGTGLAIVRLVDPRLADTMAEAVLAWTLYLSRDMPAYAAQQRQGLWKPLDYRAACDTRVGILGLGALGSAAIRMLTMAGFRTSGWSRTPKQMSGVPTYTGRDGLDAMLSQTDILVCLLPLTAETDGLVDAEVFARLPADAGFINFGRGRTVVTDALVNALDAGTLKHAVLDVFETEPLTDASPLWAHPGVTVLPHISAPTSPETATRIVAGNIARYRADGTLPERVDMARGY